MLESFGKKYIWYTMLEIKRDHAEEVILKIMMALEKRVNNKMGLNVDELKEFYNQLLHDAFTEESVQNYKPIV
jgi:hypothetical protein